MGEVVIQIVMGGILVGTLFMHFLKLIAGGYETID